MEANGFEFLFIGLNDLGAENDWVWSNGKLSRYNHWDMVQPDNRNGNQDCVALKTTERWKGYWDDEYCDLERAFFCQMDLFK